MLEIIEPQIDKSLGQRLRRERERRHIDLRSIAENTKISLTLLEGLERDDPSRWPSGIFRRSFVRSYASAIGVDPEATAREFLERFPDPHDPEGPAAQATPPTSAPSPPPGPAPVPQKAELRLKLADTGRAFARGLLLPSARVRFRAVGCDLAVILAVALGFYVAVGNFWVPLCLTLVGYYAGGILLLGNTPGVCFCALDDQSCLNAAMGSTLDARDAGIAAADAHADAMQSTLTTYATGSKIRML
jgi:transcriptional regulator with XRE-family HTH domain